MLKIIEHSMRPKLVTQDTGQRYLLCKVSNTWITA